MIKSAASFGPISAGFSLFGNTGLRKGISMIVM